MNDNFNAWNPRQQTKVILDSAWRHVNSVNYQVSLRWLFYRLYQDGTLQKDDYKKFVSIMAKARKEFYEGWRPDTLKDDTRKALIRHGSYSSPEKWVNAIADTTCWLDEWYTQDFYVEVWFEAQAMLAQFEHYTRLVTLRPFKGDPSIDFKYQIASELEAAANRYGKEIVILYFGDLDDKGQQIPYSALADIEEWCGISFDFEVAGINSEQAARYQIPDNPNKPGQYQWEALPDKAAEEIITGAIDEYINYEALDEVEGIESEANAKFEQLTKTLVEQFSGLYEQ